MLPGSTWPGGNIDLTSSHRRVEQCGHPLARGGDFRNRRGMGLRDAQLDLALKLKADVASEDEIKELRARLKSAGGRR
jgi:hypothetical protein